MKFGVKNIDYYSDYDANTFLSLANLQHKISQALVDVNLLDAAVFWLTNAERKKYNLKQFQFHNKLKQTAVLHSEQMKIHNFFSHENAVEAKFKTLTDRISSVKDNNFQGFMSCGENISDYPIIKANENFTVENRNGTQRLFSTNGIEILPYSYYEFAKIVVEGWMNSPGHRKNILNSDFTYLGCGCAKYEKQGNTYTMLYFKLTQNFGGSLMANNFLFGIEKTFNDIENGIEKIITNFKRNYPKHIKSLCFGKQKYKFNALFGDWGQKKLIKWQT